MEEKPNYYAIIPANVRYDEKLNANSKLLYGEISSLSNKYGYCIATNEYFSNLYKVSTRTITDWIKSLEESFYIKCEIETKRYEDGTIKKIRKIYINHIEDFQQNHIEDLRKNHIEENFSYNNKKNNNKKYNNIFKKPTLEEIEEYCKERGNNVDASKFIDYYESKGWMIGKNKMKDWKASVRLWERNSKITIEQDVPKWFYQDLGRGGFDDDGEGF